MIDPNNLDPATTQNPVQPLAPNLTAQSNQSAPPPSEMPIVPQQPTASLAPAPSQAAQPSSTMNPFDSDQPVASSTDFIQGLHELPGEEDIPSEKALGDQVSLVPQVGVNLPPAIEHPEVELSPKQPGPDALMSSPGQDQMRSPGQSDKSSHQEIEGKLDQINQNLQALHQKVDQLLQR